MKILLVHSVIAPCYDRSSVFQGLLRLCSKNTVRVKSNGTLFIAAITVNLLCVKTTHYSLNVLLLLFADQA